MVEEQEQQKEQAPVLPSMIAPVPDNPGEDFFKFRIDGSDILDEMGHQLRGEVYDLTERKYVKKFDRWMSDSWINRVLHITFSCGINKNTFLGNLEKEEIMYKCRMIKKKLALLFFKKHKEAELEKDMRDLLITTIINTIHSGLSRSEGGKESGQISTASQRHEVYQHLEHEQQKRGLGRLPFFSGRN
ncbi:MAG: hypothetical protein JRL30_25980 [Deltaproteobacteria bacterium]|nr:hypothetical protein [Deltaproteobacteria bacterium]